MIRSRRAAILAAGALAAAALSACGGSGGSATTASPGGSAAPAATTAAAPILLAYAGGTVSGGGRTTVPVGKPVTIRVSSDVADEVHVHGYDLKKDVAPGAPATISFVADIPGIFEVELESRSLKLTDLVVR